MFWIGGTLSCVKIPLGRVFIETPVSGIVIKRLHITGNLVGSLKECLEAIDLVRRDVLKPRIAIRPFKDLSGVYEELERGEIYGRIVLKFLEDWKNNWDWYRYKYDSEFLKLVWISTSKSYQHIYWEWVISSEIVDRFHLLQLIPCHLPRCSSYRVQFRAVIFSYES